MAKLTFRQLWFGRILPEFAPKLLRDLSKGWYALAVLQALGQALLIWLAGAPLLNLIDIVICALGGYFLSARKSRALAVALLFYALAITAMAIGARAGMTVGGRNVVLALIVVWVAIRGVQATIVYQRAQGAKVVWKHIGIAVLAVVATAGLSFTGAVAAFAVDPNLGEEFVGNAMVAATVILLALVLPPLTGRFPLARPAPAG